MKPSWKTIWLAALAAIWLANAADAREDSRASGRTLTVLVLDYAAVSDNTLAATEALSTVLLSRAGIRAQWVHCLGHAQGTRPLLCDSNLDAGMVMLRVLVAYPGSQNKRGDPLGTAMVESGYASIYASEIARYAERNGLPASTLMAYAATHEIGHLLLGAQHSSSGIMRAVWGTAEYEGMSQRWLGFDPAEVAGMQRATPAGAAMGD